MDLDRILKPKELIDRLKYAEKQCVRGYYYILIRPDVRDRIIELLKEQEPVEPTKDIARNRRCPKCFTILKGKFCHECGQAVKWE